MFERGVKTMNQEWETYKAWIAHFDILGFKELLKNARPQHSEDEMNVRLRLLQMRIDEVIEAFQKEAKEFEENLNYLFYSDTLVFYSRSGEGRHYPGILHVATHFVRKCIVIEVAPRGAISFGEIAIGHGKRTLIGESFRESYSFGEACDWIGLVLTPSASRRVKELGLDPARHGFSNQGIPLRRDRLFQEYPSFEDDEVYGYTFRQGIKNFQSPYIEKLQQMRLSSPEEVRGKYENTINFIKKYDRVEKSLSVE